jgi:hypothetical protein
MEKSTEARLNNTRSELRVRNQRQHLNGRPTDDVLGYHIKRVIVFSNVGLGGIIMGSREPWHRPTGSTPIRKPTEREPFIVVQAMIAEAARHYCASRTYIERRWQRRAFKFWTEEVSEDSSLPICSRNDAQRKPGWSERHQEQCSFLIFRFGRHGAVTPNSQHQPRTRQATNLRMQIW